MSRFIKLGFVGVLSLALLFPGTVLAAEIALVIGNRDYRHAPEAKSAEIDAREVAAALAEGGYDVTLGIDLNRGQMRRTLAGFTRKIPGADRVVIYYSGHAIRSNGTTYLAPVDQQNASLVQVMMGGVPLDLILRLAQRRPRRSVVFIDAAQLSGFTPNAISEPGLDSITPGDGVLVVSAAAPGRAVRRQDGKTSRFARDVVNQFLEPGAKAMKASRAMRSPAWTTGAVPPKLRLVSRSGGGGSVVTGEMPAEIEAAMGLTRPQRREIQENLTLLGHDPRGIDGLFGPGTRTAIRLWQRTNDLTETGYLTGEQAALLQSQSAEAANSAEDSEEEFWASTGALGTADGYRRYLEEYTDGRYAREARDRLETIARYGTDYISRREREVWLAAERRDRASDYRDYLDRYPTGIWQPSAEERLTELIANSETDPAETEQALGLTRNDRLSVEQRLKYLGFPPGVLDGHFDNDTRWAIEDYQRSRDHGATGYLDQPTLAGIMDETKDVRTGVIIDGVAVLRNILRGLE